MRKCLCINKLRSSCTRVRPASGFSLAELVVSIGVLVLMFSLAGQVFSLTMQSTGQAKAFTEINQLLRIFEDSLREDLRNVVPGKSVMLIQANPVNAYWTIDGRDADNDGNASNGYPHTADPTREKPNGSGDMIAPRADMLMFFTARKGSSFVDPRVSANLQQVVYGHVESGDYVDTRPPGAPDPIYAFQAGVNPAFPLNPSTNYASATIPSVVPARQWHLGRRGTLLVPMAIPTPNVTFSAPPGRQLTQADLTNLALSGADAIGEFRFEEDVLAPPILGAPWYLPRIVALGNPLPRSQLDEAPPARLANRLGHYFVPNCASFKVEWTLDPRSEFVNGRLDDMSEMFWFDQGRFDPNAMITAGLKYEHPLGMLHEAFDVADADPNLYTMARRLDSLLHEGTVHPDGRTYSLSDRFRGTTYAPGAWSELAPAGPNVRPNLVAFGAARRNVLNEVVPEDIFPGMLRITIDVYDDTKRLDRPIRHVMVIPVGG